MQRLGAVDADHSDVSPSLVGILVGPRDNKGDPLAASHCDMDSCGAHRNTVRGDSLLRNRSTPKVSIAVE